MAKHEDGMHEKDGKHEKHEKLGKHEKSAKMHHGKGKAGRFGKAK